MWPAGRMCILEYLPLVKDAVQTSIAQAVRVCTIRRDVFRELSSTGLGAPIELDTISYRYTLALSVSSFVSVQAPCTRSLRFRAVSQDCGLPACILHRGL